MRVNAFGQKLREGDDVPELPGDREVRVIEVWYNHAGHGLIRELEDKIKTIMEQVGAEREGSGSDDRYRELEYWLDEEIASDESKYGAMVGGLETLKIQLGAGKFGWEDSEDSEDGDEGCPGHECDNNCGYNCAIGTTHYCDGTCQG
jgi:hypothetical protein